MKRTISAIVEILVFTIPIIIVNKMYPERFSDKEALVTFTFFGSAYLLNALLDIILDSIFEHFNESKRIRIISFLARNTGFFILFFCISQLMEYVTKEPANIRIHLFLAALATLGHIIYIHMIKTVNGSKAFKDVDDALDEDKTDYLE